MRTHLALVSRLVLAACLAASLYDVAAAGPAGVVIGRGPTGAVCMARPSGASDRTWRIQCDGAPDAQGLLSESGDNDVSAEQKSVDGRHPCEAPERIVLEGLEGARRTLCPARRNGRDWLLFEAHAPGDPGRRVSLELPAELADLAGPALLAPLRGLASAPPASSAELRWKEAYRTSQTGDFAAAEQSFSEITLAASGADGQRAEAYLNWARESSNLGRPAAAAEHFRQADALIEVLHDPDLLALSALYKAVAARNESRFEDAVRWARQSIKGGQPFTPRAATGETVIDSGTAQKLNAGAPEAADPCAANAIGGCAQRRRGLRDAYAAYIAGTALEGLGDLRDAALALDEAADRMSSTLAAEGGGDVGAAWLAADIHAERARLALDLGDVPAALTRARAAREAVRAAPALAGGERDVATRLLLARVEATHGDAQASQLDYDLAFETLRTGSGGLSVNPEDAEAYFDRMLSTFGKGEDAQTVVIDHLLSAMQSLQFDETGAGLLRLRRRLEQGEGADAALAKGAAVARKALATARLTIDSAREDAAGQSALNAAREDLRAREQALVARRPELGRTGYNVATTGALRAALAKGEIYVKILLFANRGYGLAIASQGARAYRIPMGRKDAAARVDALRRPFDDPIRLTRFDVEASHGLYGALFGPVADAAAKAKRVIYDADASLLSLPPALLVTDEASVRRYQSALRASRETGRHDLDLYAGVNWLGRRTEVTSSLSPQTFLELRRSPPSSARRAYSGFGSARPESAEDPNLFAAIAEVDRYAPDCAQTRRSSAALAAQTPPRPAATTALRNIAYGVTGGVETTATQLSDIRVLLIGARGFNPSANGCLGAPALATSLGDARADGLLTADRIAGLKLDAELVVLTGWSTAATADAGDAEELSGQALSGLADAFVAAGARNLMFSHWEAPTRATVQMLTETLSAKDAEAAALRRAQIRLMDAPETAHPYYWAGFSLVGDGARSLAPPSR